jgi:hypothetical protein
LSAPSSPKCWWRWVNDWHDVYIYGYFEDGVVDLLGNTLLRDHLGRWGKGRCVGEWIAGIKGRDGSQWPSHDSTKRPPTSSFSDMNSGGIAVNFPRIQLWRYIFSHHWSDGSKLNLILLKLSQFSSNNKITRLVTYKQRDITSHHNTWWTASSALVAGSNWIAFRFFRGYGVWKVIIYVCMCFREVI